MERDLVLRARNGDHEAFTALASAAFARLYRTARLILRSDDQAADAVQDSLLAAWLHIRAVRDPDRFDAWLNRLLVNACYREARRVRQRGVVEIQMTLPDARAPGDTQELTAVRDQLERGFRRLSPSSGPCSWSTTTSGCRMPRRPLSSTSRSARSSPGSIAPRTLSGLHSTLTTADQPSPRSPSHDRSRRLRSNARRLARC